MTGFDNYKNTNYKQDNFIMKIYDFLGKVFNIRVRKIILRSVAAFCGGVLVAGIAVGISSHFSKPSAGIGGLETSVVPQFSDTLEALTSLERPDAFTNDVQDNLSITGADNLDSAVELFDQDEMAQDNTSTLELCYFPYKVKKGDMIGFIADKFGITADTIISVNNIHQSRLLQIGQYLKIPSMPGIIYTVKNNSETITSVAEKYEVSAEKCARVNSMSADSKLVAGKSLFVPDAQLDWVTRQEINGDLFRRPLKSKYYLSSYFGWRSSPFTGKRSYHSGVDMACPSGTPIYAALGGTVTSVGYNNIYGNYVIVTHHSGYKTLYAHMSATLVTRGKYVDTNTKIGKVGSTGLSTGPHLHFTVFKFGKTVNPMTLWK